MHAGSWAIASIDTCTSTAIEKANASLIAAAPDMLAALVMLTRGYGLTFQDAAVRNVALDAIAKATGGSGHADAPLTEREA